jgi:hypothetical protein
MKESFKMEIDREKESTHGQTRVSMRENGFAIK